MDADRALFRRRARRVVPAPTVRAGACLSASLSRPARLPAGDRRVLLRLADRARVAVRGGRLCCLHACRFRVLPGISGRARTRFDAPARLAWTLVRRGALAPLGAAETPESGRQRPESPVTEVQSSRFEPRGRARVRIDRP